MSVFHRKHSGSSKNLPVLLSSEGPSNFHADGLPDLVQDQVHGIANEVHEVVNGKKATIPSKTIDHFRSYPLVQQTRSFLHQIPVARVVLSNTKPMVKQVLESKPLQLALPVTNAVDSVANLGLNLTEKIIPSLKTKTYQRLGEEAMIPYHFTAKYGKIATDQTFAIVEKNVYNPAHSQVLKFRKYYNEKFYDTKGKPLVRSTFDPVTAPVNNVFEKLTIKYFPNGKDVPKEGYSSELNRSLALFINFVSRTAPIVEQNVLTITMLPCNYAKHVNDVFNKSLDKQPQMTLKYSWTASKDAVKQLEREMIRYVKGKSPTKMLKRSKNTIQENVEQVENEIQAQVA
ncbi:hypothetical protein HG535_0F00790 [Zygotorulaspora mrakii]|uniref:Uncharacterized protein n=1 Tax=Zygotorulaspora mrakii TaxID=42260 RepID=A0A7H9B6I5_ZYGMR|nr:uncharacterized protein HG535_0F00790 [Zygotorulaspora mrakii]QLG73569.1 hypothetical protein HG535_0F00790 [Zygotorulaspora mrakii]